MNLEDDEEILCDECGSICVAGSVNTAETLSDHFHVEVAHAHVVCVVLGGTCNGNVTRVWENIIIIIIIVRHHLEAEIVM